MDGDGAGVATFESRESIASVCSRPAIDLEDLGALRHDANMGETLESGPLARPHVAPRHRGVRPVFLLALALVLSFSVLVMTRARTGTAPGRAERQRADWFSENKAHCNALEVKRFLAAHAPAPTLEVTAQHAACLAIAGKIADARQLILGLSPSQRNDAVNNVFLIAHPVADAGDDESAGPIMELVLEFQRDQYMALYHAGMAMAITGDDDKARGYLARFLALYHNPDGWNQNARKALEALERPRAQRTVALGSEGSIVY